MLNQGKDLIVIFKEGQMCYISSAQKATKGRHNKNTYKVPSVWNVS